MTHSSHVLISLEERYAAAIFAGEKTVELRRRPMNVEPGSTVWIYSKVPVGSLVGSVRVSAVTESSPTALWNQFGAVSGLSRREFYEYFAGVRKGFALELERPCRLGAALPLQLLRELQQGFQPPQFFARLAAHHPFISAAMA